MVERLIAGIRRRVGAERPPRRVTQLITEVLREDHSELTAFETAGKVAQRVLAGLQRVHQEAETVGTDPWFAFNSSSQDYIQGPSFVEPRDTPEVRAAKINRLNRYPLQTIIQRITPEQFEKLCVGALGLLGARDYAGTKRSRDQGIDFYGRLIISDLDASTSPFFRLTDRLSVWLVGQAKHYPDRKVSSPEIRDLVGSVNLARFKEYASTTELMKSLPLRSCDPVIALFLTTGTFSRDAVKLASGSGVVIQDIGDICSLLADNRVGLDADGHLSEDAVLAWIDRQGRRVQEVQEA